MQTTLLAEGNHANPHHFLGLHETSNGQVIRLFRPQIKRVYLEVCGQIVEASKVDELGLFEYVPRRVIGPDEYRIYHSNGCLALDPYAQGGSIGEMDLFLFNKGCHYNLYSILGANVSAKGTRFAVWAPNATRVSVVGDFNHWDGRLCPMRSLGSSGIWELFIPGIGQGEKYKFEIRTGEGYLRLKSDPFAFYSELRPLNASIVFDINAYPWQDSGWKKPSLEGPINIYEVHLGSWKAFGDEFPNYRTLAVNLANYCKKMGFTHVELMPILEHPLDESWGYQVSGFFAATSRYGTPADFQYFVDHMHQEGIGVILDWVPAHFPTDDHSLNRFDGTALYEHEDPRKGMHPHWHTAIFNYGRKEVSNFLIASALFWLDKMHVDGLRVDAVASLLYLDYGRNPGEWTPNPDGSNFNTEAIEYLKHMNAIIHDRFPGTLMIAEESSSYAKVTHSDGLGFDLKWNMGWMNDTLSYFSKDPIYRKFYQNHLTFGLLYAFNERFLSVLSHDEVVHGKKSLLSKMPGPDWQKFASLRLLYSYMICYPGKKLIFMGAELASWHEWDCKSHLDWSLLDHAFHKGMFDMVHDLNHYYLQQKALWTQDFQWEGYEWVDFADTQQSVISYLRKDLKGAIACIHHFTPEFREEYRLPIKGVKQIREVFNSDALHYGGSGKLNQQVRVEADGISIGLAPLATQIFEIEWEFI